MTPTFFATPANFRAWLTAHHASAAELLVGFRKVGTGHPSITWPEAVDEALCFGWIDGRRHGLGAEAYAIRFTPRRAGSIWSNKNVASVARLAAEGRMQPAGAAAFAARREARSGVYSFERAAPAALAPDLEARFRADAPAWTHFSAQPPGYQRTLRHWVMSAKGEATRLRRLDRLIAVSAAGERVDMEFPFGRKA